MSDSLYPIAVLVEELKSQEVKRRVNSMKNLGTIAIGLGYERTRKELVPYLAELMDDEEEVLLAMATSLKDFVSLVGGKTHAHILLEPLEQLCQVEDASVRTAAVQSLGCVVNLIDDRLLDEVVLDLLQRLTDAEWFTSRVSAAQFLPIAVLLPLPDSSVSTSHALPSLTSRSYSSTARLSPGRVDQAMEIFSSLVRDQHPQVRRAAGEALKELTGLKAQQARLMGLLAELMADNEDSVRLLVVDSLVELARNLSQPQLTTQALPLIRALVSDQSWRVRYKLADCIAVLGTAAGTETVKASLQTAFTCLLQDSEAEVRTAAYTRISEFCKLLEMPAIVSEVFPRLQSISGEPEYIRAALASQIAKLCVVVGRQHTNDALLRVVFELMRDDSAEVRMCLFSDLANVQAVIGSESLAQSLMPAVAELVDHKNWRVRQQLLERMPDLALQLGTEFFTVNLVSVLSKGLCDPVWSVRESLIGAVKKLTETLGEDWVSASILPQVSALKVHVNYLLRITALRLVKDLESVVSSGFCRVHLYPLLIELSADPVPNVRLNVAKTIQALARHFEFDAVSPTQEDLKVLLRVLSKDSDPDVRFYSEGALRRV
jgi:serine/threonine-protein phosphatase 2A regulatory subunit A